MAKILLLDFKDSDCRRFLDEKFDVELKETNWKTGKVESLFLAEDCRVVFYQAELSSYASGLHAGDSENFEKIVDEGGAIVCFVGNCQEYHLTNIIGEIPHLKFEENKLPTKIYEIAEEPYATIFAQFGPYVSHAYELFPTQNSLGKSLNLKEWDPPYNGELQVLAESYRNYPVSFLLRKGKGFYLLLPWFGEKNLDVARFVLNEILGEIPPQRASGAKETESWLNSSDYFFPGLLDIRRQMDEEKERHRQAMLSLEEKIEEIRATEQEPFNRLLTAEGPDLKQAVVRAFKYLDWLNVIDVDEYWRHVIRIKEEDIWLVDEDEKSVEQLIRGSELILVTVRSSESGATDDDCLLLQRYKGRRMQEFDNTRMKALLLGNYHCRTEAKLRGVPFTETQIGEAVNDGNGILTTYELFKAIKAEKEKKITKEAIREHIKNKVGLITFDC
ncbi:MAG: hypothetical protein QHH14_01120 [Clostridiales bacterium]|nr:hypothetical protein [Clostridiales bacterium]